MAQVPFGAAAARGKCTDASTSSTPTSSRLIASCAAAFSRYRRTQHPVPICPSSSRCPAPRHVENLSPPAISWPDNPCHCFSLAVAVISPLDSLLVSPAPRRAAENICEQKHWWLGACRNRETQSLPPIQPCAGDAELLLSIFLRCCHLGKKNTLKALGGS